MNKPPRAVVRDRALLIAFVLAVVLLAVLVRSALAAAPTASNPTLRAPLSAVGTVTRSHVAAGGVRRGSMASSYGPGLYGNPMACGGTLWPTTRAVAHRSLRCGTRLVVCSRRRCTLARVRDRGPFVAGRELDLSEAVVRELGYRDAWAFGVRYVSWRVRAW